MCAAEAPCFGTVNKPRLDGILFDVGQGVAVMLFIAHEAVEVLAEPEGAFALEHPVGLLGGIGFPRVHNCGEFPTLPHFDEHMDVIGYDAPCQQLVALRIEMQQGVLQNLRNDGLAQPARAMVCILITGNAVVQLDYARVCGGQCFKPAQLEFPFVDCGTASCRRNVMNCTVPGSSKCGR